MQTTIRHFGAAILLICASAALSIGCGGAAQTALSPGGETATKSEPPPTNVPDAIAELDQAEASVTRALERPPGASASADRPASPPPAASAEPYAQNAQKSPAEAAAGAAPSPASDSVASSDPCSTACRALESMGRAVEHVCVLAGESDEHCSNARERVGRATERVRAQCPSCS